MFYRQLYFCILLRTMKLLLHLIISCRRSADFCCIFLFQHLFVKNLVVKNMLKYVVWHDILCICSIWEKILEKFLSDEAYNIIQPTLPGASQSCFSFRPVLQPPNQPYIWEHFNFHIFHNHSLYQCRQKYSLVKDILGLKD